MAVEKPKRFTDLQELSSLPNSFVNLMGVVVDFLPPNPSGGTDWQCTFCIEDEYCSQKFKIKWFSAGPPGFPSIRNIGDVVMCERIKVSKYHGTVGGLANRHTRSSCVVLPVNLIPASIPSLDSELRILKKNACQRLGSPKEPSEADIRYAIFLCNSHKSSLPAQKPNTQSNQKPHIQSNQKPRGFRDKFSTIDHIKIHNFYDLVCEVVKIWDAGDRVELSVTDYTENELLYDKTQGQDEDYLEREGDPYDYVPRHSTDRANENGPDGKRIIQVATWEATAVEAKDKFQVGDYIFLQNVRIKQNSSGKIEGIIYGDRNYPEKVMAWGLDKQDGRVKDLLRRKRAYWSEVQQKPELFQKDEGCKKRKVREEEKPKSESKKRKQKKEAVNVRGDVNLGRISKEFRLNQHVRTNRPDTRYLRVPDIKKSRLTTTPDGHNEYIMPFENIVCRANVRVVDFFPPDLEDFAVFHQESEYDVLSDHSSDDDYDDEPGSTQGRWEWRFCLLVEDAEASATTAKGEAVEWLKLFVSGMDAEGLLNLTATDLRKDTKTLSKLREQLFILWGDLEERKQIRRKALEERDNVNDKGTLKLEPAPKAFPCCIQEYGIRSKENKDALGQWKKCFRITGTAIK
ncbi:MAG: hypothetical protein M1834_001063 [Cirrosporium novae-zelandiae]|nr:MAG: hypothetical protein M1834_001063 [Cirrosporium novae-zelandiae]